MENFVKERFESYELGDLACNFNVSADYGVSDVFLYRCGGDPGLGAISLIILVARVWWTRSGSDDGVVIGRAHTK